VELLGGELFSNREREGLQHVLVYLGTDQEHD
jgi:hypothetical protein